MDANEMQLLRAAICGDVEALLAALAAGVDPNPLRGALTALQWSSACGHLACVQALLAAAADCHVRDETGRTALTHAALRGNVEIIGELLAAGCDPAAADVDGWTALRWATQCGHVDAARALAAAAPHLALLPDKKGRLPLEAALASRRFAVARCLLEHGAQPPASQALAALEAARCHCQLFPYPFPPSLYTPVVARQPLTPADWALVPAPCPGLSAALPAVLARSDAEAALLVARLPADERERLQAAALCLHRAERAHGLSLPLVLLRPLLLAALE